MARGLGCGMGGKGMLKWLRCVLFHKHVVHFWYEACLFGKCSGNHYKIAQKECVSRCGVVFHQRIIKHF